MDIREAYAVLELPVGASVPEIEAAYKTLAAVWHPDRFTANGKLFDAAEVKLRTINEARTVLDEFHSSPGFKHGSGLLPKEIVDDEVKYLGRDPRLPTGTTNSRVVLCLDASGIALVFPDRDKTRAVQHYDAESIEKFADDGMTWTKAGYRGSRFDPDFRVWVTCRDPAGIVKDLTLILQFRNAYHKELFVRTAAALFGFAQHHVPPAKAVTPTVSAEPKPTVEGVVLAVVVGIAVIVVLGILLGNFGHSSTVAPSTPNEAEPRAWPPGGYTGQPMPGTKPTEPVQSRPGLPPLRTATEHLARARESYDRGEYERAIADGVEASRRAPNNAEPYDMLGASYHALGKFELARSAWLNALRVAPNYVNAINNLAWFYATCPDAQFRDASKAQELAWKAYTLKGGDVAPLTLSAMAAANAESGDFNSAVANQTEALRHAPASMKAEYESRLRLYKSNKPYRDLPKR